MVKNHQKQFSNSSLPLYYYNNDKTGDQIPELSTSTFLPTTKIVTEQSLASNNNNINSFGDDCIDVNAYLLDVQNDLTEYSSVRAVFGLLYSVIFVLGVGGNVSMLYSIFWGRHHQRLRSSWTVANIFLANLGASDLLLCLTAVPLSPPQIMLKIWYFGWLMCKISPFSQGTSVLISSLSLCSIAGDRYWSIVDISRKRVSRKWALLTVLLLWFAAFSVNLPLYLSMDLAELKGEGYQFCGLYCEESEWAHPYLRRSYGTVVLLVQFLFPVLFLAYCYFKILIKVRQDLVVDRDGMLTNDQQNRAAKRKRRVTYILIAMVAAFVMSWAPLTLINIFVDYGLPLGPFYERQIYLVHLIVHWIAMTSVVWNPILYFWMSQSTKRSSTTAATVGTSHWDNTTGARGAAVRNCGGGLGDSLLLSKSISFRTTTYGHDEFNDSAKNPRIDRFKWKNKNSEFTAAVRFHSEFQFVPSTPKTPERHHDSKASNDSHRIMETSCNVLLLGSTTAAVGGTNNHHQDDGRVSQPVSSTTERRTLLKRKRSEPILFPSSSIDSDFFAAKTVSKPAKTIIDFHHL